MKPKQQLIYLPVKLEHNFVLSVLEEGRIIDKVIEKQAIIFTPEELNEYTQQVIKDALKVVNKQPEDKLERAIKSFSKHIQNLSPEEMEERLKKYPVENYEDTYKL